MKKPRFIELLAVPIVAFTSTAQNAAADVDLVAWWPLDELTGETTPDASGNGYHITAQGDMDDSSLIEGKVNGAFTFDGFDDMLVLASEPGADLPISQHSQFTIGLWVRGEFDIQEGDRRVFSEASESSGNPLFNIGTKNDAADATVDIFLRDGGGGTDEHQFSFNEGFNGEWHHITLIRDEDLLTLYVDGEEDTELIFRDVYDDSVNTTSIGGIARAALSHWFTGDVDDVALFKSVLTEEEIAQLMDGSLLAGFDPDADDDGMRDAWETENGVDDPAADPDGDLLTNLQEHDLKTDPNEADTDGDNLNDNVETNTGTWVSATDTGTDPNDSDSDGDGLKDGVETNTGTFVSAEDTGTNPNIADTDEDGFKDGTEVTSGTDPNDEESVPDAEALVVAWWPLDEISGDTTPDASGNGYDMELNGIEAASLIPGKFGSAIAFDGSTMLSRTHEEGEDLPISQHEQHTIALWVKGNFEDQIASDRRVFSEASDIDGDPLLNIGTHNANADGTVDIFLRNGGGHRTSILSVKHLMESGTRSSGCVMEKRHSFISMANWMSSFSSFMMHMHQM